MNVFFFFFNTTYTSQNICMNNYILGNFSDHLCLVIIQMVNILLNKVYQMHFFNYNVIFYVIHKVVFLILWSRKIKNSFYFMKWTTFH